MTVETMKNPVFSPNQNRAHPKRKPAYQPERKAEIETEEETEGKSPVTFFWLWFGIPIIVLIFVGWLMTVTR